MKKHEFNSDMTEKEILIRIMINTNRTFVAVFITWILIILF